MAKNQSSRLAISPEQQNFALYVNDVDMTANQSETIEVASWPIVSLDGLRGFKCVPSRIPPINHFQRIADQWAWDVLDALEAMTDDQARDEIGQIELIPASERFYGKRLELVMAAFTNFNPNGSLFSDGSYGVLYLQMQEALAVSEMCLRTAEFLAATNENPTTVQLDLYSIELTGNVADLRGIVAIRSEILASATSIESRNFGTRLHAAGVAGALYQSALDQGGESIAAFKTTVVSDCVGSAFLEFNWDGQSLIAIRRDNV